MASPKTNQKIVTVKVKPATTSYMQTAKQDYLAIHIY
jgi:hypothetical protein